MAERKPISKSKRFEIFERDQFTCQYCGEQPPKVILHVDHIIPVAKGGCNDPENLRTSCSACNLGKHTKKLGKQKLADNPRRAQEALEAIDTAELFSKASESRNKLKDDVFVSVYEATGIELKKNEIGVFVKAVSEFGAERILELIDEAFSRLSTQGTVRSYHFVPYFCGMLRKIRSEENE